MRKSILLPLAVLGCAAGDDEGAFVPYAVIEDLPAAATPVVCQRVAVDGDPAVTEIRSITDSTWLLLDGPGRQILELDGGARVLGRTRIPRQGPGSAERPVSAAALGDTAWAIAARGGLRLVRLSRSGRELGTVPLDFIPNGVAATPSGAVLLTATPFGTRPPTLLMRLDGETLTPVDVPRREYPDMNINALGNMALVETLDDGTAFVVHQLLEPRAFAVGPGPVVTRLTVPTPAGTRDAIGFVPTAPVTEDQIPRTLVPALAMTVDRGREEAYLLTRSGRRIGERPERLVMRVARDFSFLQAFTLDVPAEGLAVLPRAGALMARDDADTVYRCPLPPSP